MAEVNAEKAEKVSDFLFRYMPARHRFKENTMRGAATTRQVMKENPPWWR
jgi:hypothetical protein